MSDQKVQLRSIAGNIDVLSRSSTLADFISACRSNTSIRKVDFYVMTGAEEIMKGQPNIKSLPIYCKAAGSDQQITRVEQPPLYLGTVAYSVTDRDCSKPLGLSSIDPIENLKGYAGENAIYLAQHGFNVTSHFRFRSGPMEEVCRIMAQEAKKYRPLSLPIVIYL